MPTSTNAEPQAGAPAPRIEWVDVAKALAIVLVVAYHVSTRGTAYLLPGSDDWWTSLWRDSAKILLPVRMPLFFLVSGVLAHRALQRPWGKLWRPRIADLLWPFLLWSLFHGAAYGWGFEYGRGDPWQSARTDWAAIPFGGTAYWYLSLLVVFFIAARLVRSQPAPALLLAFVAWFGSGVVRETFEGVVDPILLTNIHRASIFAIWFFLGCFARRSVLAAASIPLWPTLPLAVGLYSVIAYQVYGVRSAGVQWTYALNVLGVLSAVLLSVLLARSDGVRSVARKVARRTLAIYVIHPVLLNLLVLVTRREDGYAGIQAGGSELVGALFVPVLTAALVALAIGIQVLAERWGAPWLFAFPRRRADRTAADEAPPPPAGAPQEPVEADRRDAPVTATGRRSDPEA